MQGRSYVVGLLVLVPVIIGVILYSGRDMPEAEEESVITSSPPADLPR